MLALALVALVAVSASATVSTLIHLRLPAPAGPYTIGKSVAIGDGGDGRSIRLVTWYPAVAGTGTAAAYIEGLDAIRDGLVSSGSVDAAAAAALGAVSDPSRRDARPDPAQATYPVIILSPGNATNVEFYGALATDLASRGYVVVGVDHPGQSGAVAMPDGVVVYGGDPALEQAELVTRERIAARETDLLALLDGLGSGSIALGPIDGRLDLGRVGLLGHSNGGVASAMACHDPRISACANMDGQLAGGPFSASPDPVPPTKPFLFLTKETSLHPRLAEVFEAGPGSFRVVIPAATHDAFTDGPAFQPRLLPLRTTADDVMTVSRGVVAAFFAHTLQDAPITAFADLEAPTDLRILVYPLSRR